MTATLKLSFSCGSHLLTVNSAPDAYDVSPPRLDFDVAIINPGPPTSRCRVLQSLRSVARDRNTLALIGRGDWTQADFAQFYGLRLRFFVNDVESTQIAKGLGELSGAFESACLALSGALGSTVTVVVSRGEAGCVSVNGARQLLSVPTASLRPVSLVGAGDTFTTTVSISAAAGAGDRVACLRGNAEAARLITGRRPAAALKDLDEDVASWPVRVGAPD